MCICVELGMYRGVWVYRMGLDVCVCVCVCVRREKGKCVCVGIRLRVCVWYDLNCVPYSFIYLSVYVFA